MTIRLRKCDLAELEAYSDVDPALKRALEKLLYLRINGNYEPTEDERRHIVVEEIKGSGKDPKEYGIIMGSGEYDGVLESLCGYAATGKTVNLGKLKNGFRAKRRRWVKDYITDEIGRLDRDFYPEGDELFEYIRMVTKQTVDKFGGTEEDFEPTFNLIWDMYHKMREA